MSFIVISLFNMNRKTKFLKFNFDMPSCLRTIRKYSYDIKNENTESDKGANKYNYGKLGDLCQV